jgi:hypothetical protein
MKVFQYTENILPQHKCFVFCFAGFSSNICFHKECIVCLQLQNQLDESKSNVSKEIRVRERAEQYAKDLEAEIERIKRKHMGRADSTANLELSEEIARYSLWACTNNHC